MSIETLTAPIDVIATCNRLVGLRVAACRCRIGDDGWQECPAAARGILSRDFIEANLAVLRGADALQRGTSPAGFTTALPPPSARQQGFTGSICPNCGSAKVIRNGTCELCLGCGNSVGGCS